MDEEKFAKAVADAVKAAMPPRPPLGSDPPYTTMSLETQAKFLALPQEGKIQAEVRKPSRSQWQS